MERISRRAFLATSVGATSALSHGGLLGMLDAQAATPVAPTLAQPAETGATYLAVAPRVLRAGQEEQVSLSLLQNDQPIRGAATVSLLKDAQAVSEAAAEVDGHGALALTLPVDLAEGEYQLQVATLGFQDTAAVQVERGTIVFVETDKPIYQPGQTIHMRVLTLDSALKPLADAAVVEVMDASGLKVFKATTMLDDFGMASLDLPLSTEPNLGVWKVRATSGRRSAQRDVRVEHYVLPKFEVRVDLPREWALASQPISGTVGAEYTFGKPVKGEAEIVASRYVGGWQEYARVSGTIDGRFQFEVPAVQYAVGSPAAGGLAQVRLDAKVREQATNYEEQVSRLLTIASTPVSVRVIPESNTFKRGLPFSLLIVAETPDQKPVDTTVEVRLSFQGDSSRSLPEESRRVSTSAGLATLQVSAPRDAVSVTIQASATNAGTTSLTLRAGYSPTGTFIHVEQSPPGALKVGETAHFTIASTREAVSLYYEILARGKMVFSDVSLNHAISFTVTPLMAPESRLLVYQVVGSSEVAADYVPFKVEGSLPHAVQVNLSASEVKPSQAVEVSVQTEGAAHIGLVAVDRAVFILAENRLNLRQVFSELERLYQKPRIELHEVAPFGAPPGIGGQVPGGPMPGGGPALVAPRPPIARGDAQGGILPGAKEVFQDAGVVVLTNRQIPEGKPLQPPMPLFPGALAPDWAPAAPSSVAAQNAAQGRPDTLAPVEHLRQFFPETWVWSTLASDATGRASQPVTAPDSITTWMVRAVALSKEKGLGIGEAELRVFQPFFVQLDLPYSAIRGEELPARVALYNYQPTPQDVVVELESAAWFDLLDASSKSVTVAPNNVGAVAFKIRPKGLGAKLLKITARSGSAADAIVRELIVEAEGVPREIVQNLVLASGTAHLVDLAAPRGVVDGSARAFLALTGNVLSQTMDGLENLLQMSYGCGEQNMILFAPNVFVARYLKETGQLRPEVLAKAELLMLTGYQRELTYRRSDGSFSAFGQQDSEGSLWLTAFVLKTFAQARGLVFIDDAILSTAREWIRRYQKPDGSFETVGFVHHQELLGGLSGRTALTGFVAIALREAGDELTAAPAIRYLEQQLGATEGAYAVAISAYALALGNSGRAQDAHDRLMALAHESEEGLFWRDAPALQPPSPQSLPPRPVPERSTAVETTAYATLALLAQSDPVNASRAVRWLASKRNSRGGFGSTQDTVVALQAMATAAGSSRADLDATVSLQGGTWTSEVRLTPDNADVLQVIQVPAEVTAVTLQSHGRGVVMGQSVLRFNLPSAQPREQGAFVLDVRYGTDQVAVNDTILIAATLLFTPSERVAAGMVVIDIAVPTGFAPETATIEELGKREPRLKRWDVAGRKVIFYLETMLPDQVIELDFRARALYPVRAQPVSSQAYAYYRPEWSGESLGSAITVV